MIWSVLGFACVFRCGQWCARQDALKAVPWLVVGIFCAAAAWT